MVFRIFKIALVARSKEYPCSTHSRKWWILHLWQPISREFWSTSEKDSFFWAALCCSAQARRASGGPLPLQLFRGPRISPTRATGEWLHMLLFPWDMARSPKDQVSLPAAACDAEDMACKICYYLELPKCWRLPAKVCHLAATQLRADWGTGKKPLMIWLLPATG